MKHTLKLIVLSFGIVLLWWAYDMYTSPCVHQDGLGYCRVDTYAYTGGLAPRTDAGTTVVVYDIVDAAVGLRFQYRDYWVQQDGDSRQEHIMHQVYHIPSDLYSGLILYVAEGGWQIVKLRYPKIPIVDMTGAKDVLRVLYSGFDNHGCKLTDATHFITQHPRFAGADHIALSFDLQEAGIEKPGSCPFFWESLRFPVFVFDKKKPGSLLVFMVPEGIGGVVDMNRLETLAR